MPHWMIAFCGQHVVLVETMSEKMKNIVDLLVYAIVRWVGQKEVAGPHRLHLCYNCLYLFLQDHDCPMMTRFHKNLNECEKFLRVVHL